MQNETMHAIVDCCEARTGLKQGRWLSIVVALGVASGCGTHTSRRRFLTGNIVAGGGLAMLVAGLVVAASDEEPTCHSGGLSVCGLPSERDRAGMTLGLFGAALVIGGLVLASGYED
jgi:hypothetical protein